MAEFFGDVQDERDRLRVERTKLIQLIKDMDSVISDIMKSTGGNLIVQDYGKLNDVLLRATPYHAEKR